MAKVSTPKERQSGSLRKVTKKARGREYSRWQWRTHKRTDTGWTTVDVELGENISGMRTKVLVGLGELSAPVLVERYARRSFDYIETLPAWTGRPKEAKGQQAAWWIELPKKKGDSVKLRFRSLGQDSDYDFRWSFFRERVAKVEEYTTVIHNNLANDPILKLAEVQWVISEINGVIEKTQTYLAEAKKLRREGELTKDEFEDQQRHYLASQDIWEGHRSDAEQAWDGHLKAMVEAMPRTRRERDRSRIVALAERHFSNPRQREHWENERWNDGTLTISLPVIDKQ